MSCHPVPSRGHRRSLRSVRMMSRTSPSLSQIVRSEESPSMKLVRMERELEMQIKESFEESQALRERLQNDFEHMRDDTKRRLAERKRYAKKEQARCEERISRVERDKAAVLQHAELLREQLLVSAREVSVARDRIFILEAEAQAVRASPPQVIERADPGMVAETVRLRDRATATEERTRQAQRAAAEARESVGRESAINQALQRDVDNARHRLLTVQGSLAEALEDTAGLRRELEAERIKTAAGSRRLADAVERQDAALAEVRRDTAQLRNQRDSLAQDYAVLGIKLHQLKKKEAAGRVLHVLSQARSISLGQALRAWKLWVADDIHSKKQVRRQEEHASEVAALEEDLHGAETRCRDERRRNEDLRASRENVAELAGTATRRRGGVAAAAEERGAPALQWCFWGWARVTRGGDVAGDRRARRVQAEKELACVKELLQDCVERAQDAEKERDRYRASNEMLREDVNHQTLKLETSRAALSATQSLLSTVRNRSIHFGAVCMHKTLEKSRRNKMERALARWVETGRSFTSSLEDFADNEQPLARKAASLEESPPEAETAQARINAGARFDGPEVLTHTDGWQPLARKAALLEESPQETETAEARIIAAVQYDGAQVLTGTDCNTPHTIATQRRGVAPSVIDEAASVGLSNEINCDNYVPPALLGVDTYDGGSQTVNDASRCIPVTRSAPGSLAPDRSGSLTNLCTDDVAVPFSARDRSRGETPAFTNVSSDSGRASTDDRVCISLPSDLPRLMLGLRGAVGEELYSVGERLLRCVEADHRELHGKPYHPIRLTGAERDQFRVCLKDAAGGSLRRAVLTFLRAQESHRAVAEERDRSEREAGRVWNSGEGQRGGEGDNSASRGLGISGFSRSEAKDKRKVEEERNCGLSSLTTGSFSNPSQKARAARVLRDRLVVLLENADEVWEKHRRPWQTLRAGVIAGGLQARRTNQSKRATTRYARNGNNEGMIPRRLHSLDSGAGPRIFWEAMAGPRFVEASWKVDLGELEQQLWSLANLVREQDCRKGVALRRCERLRRSLDQRIYEILLLYVRTQLIWDGIDDGIDATIVLDHDASLPPRWGWVVAD